MSTEPTIIIVIWQIMYQACQARNMILLIVTIIPLMLIDPSPPSWHRMCHMY